VLKDIGVRYEDFASAPMITDEMTMDIQDNQQSQGDQPDIQSFNSNSATAQPQQQEDEAQIEQEIPEAIKESIINIISAASDLPQDEREDFERAIKA